jgi:cell division protein FtsW
MKIRQPIKTQDDVQSIEPPKKPAMPELAVFILFAFMITLFGLIMLYSTSFVTQGSSYFRKQLMWMFIGLFAGAGTIMIGAKRLSDWSPVMILVLELLLVWALFCKPINGARRWIQVAGFTLQPSELGKVVITLFLAKFLAARTRALESEPFKKVMFPSGIWVGPVILLVLAGEDLGTTVLLGSLYLLMLFVAGMRLRYILPFALILPPAAVLFIKQFDAMRWSRLTVFMDAETYKMTSGYQLWNSLLALGSGGWTGVGFTESRLKLMYLPENHTDFILSIVGEELGFVTLLTVIVAYLILVYVGLRISVKARTRQGMLIAFGMSIFIGMQALINIGVITAAFPTKGMPAPMISYGGSNLLACLVAAACVASVAIDSAIPDYPDKFLAWVGRRLHFTRSSGPEGIGQSS